jgi:hypothetical protein
MSVLLKIYTLYLRNTDKKLLLLTPVIITPLKVLASFLHFNSGVVDTCDETLATATAIKQFKKSSNNYHMHTHKQKINS